ncbi:hypothetical protein Arub01_16360 [Actinomadura rubrobrunea]|uniref:Uncharacterized protein n=1 Tax=Actinomadura rubrobrunea TaxID=115335 RepID=A0A9W6UVM3_9ACTN|nr:hypothetical protein [Actinomadura rubrobrunea]GLW63392.1 hypothetical protein Arub01_16360 [Actinomadura rubrobrunea]
MTRRTDYGFRQFAALLGVTAWQLRLAQEHDLLPGPDLEGRRWSAELADRYADSGPRIVAAFGEDPPVGAAKAAARLALRVGLDVERADIEVLVARGDLTVISRFQGNPVYMLRDLDALDPDTIASVVAARKGPLFDSVDARGAATILDWPKGVFERIAAERRLPTDQLGRYSIDQVRALAADDEIADRVRRERDRTARLRARRTRERCENTLRDWLLRCNAYLDGAVTEPPKVAEAGRALRALAAARAATARTPDPQSPHSDD